MPRAVAAPRVLTDNASDTVRGIALALLAYLIWTMGDATAKLTLPTAGVAGAMLWRGVFGALTVLIVTMAQPGRAGWRLIIPVRWCRVLLRSVLSSFVSVTWYISWESMSLALPSVAPLTTAQHRAMSTLGRHERTTAHKRDSQPQTQTGEKSRCCEAQQSHHVSYSSSVAGCDVALCVDVVVTVL